MKILDGNKEKKDNKRRFKIIEIKVLYKKRNNGSGDGGGIYVRPGGNRILEIIGRLWKSRREDCRNEDENG